MTSLPSWPYRKFRLGDRVTKTSGSCWTGFVVGFYSTTLTPVGYVVESETERGTCRPISEKDLKSLPFEGDRQ